VIKIEPPEGDQYRSWPAAFALVGRNKRSVTLDLTTPAGREVFMRLVAEVDVVVENLPRALAEKRGITPEAMRAVKPSLVVVSASGFGPDGPYADRPANGTVAEAFTGLTGLTGAADGAPQLPNAPLGDALAAAFGAFGALAGVIRALRTGEGATVDVTVHEPLLHALGTTLSSWQPGTPAPQRDGGAMGVVLRGTFGTADGGWIAMSASTPRQQQAVADLAGGDPATALRDRAAAWIATIDRATAGAALIDARVPATPVHDFAEMAADPQIEHRRSLASLIGATVVRPTPVIDGDPTDPTIPELGEANGEVLGGWLGITATELDDLRAAGVV
jgi:crotonobetainyl-CoA:carnitine CoA-transferase CaiB-like acyl-CoA transferase